MSSPQTYIRVGVQSREANAKLNALTNDFKKAGGEISRTFADRLTGKLGAFGQTISRLAGPVTAVGASVAGLGVAMAELARRTSETINQQGRLAQRLGVSLQTFSALAHAAAQTGADAEDLSDVLGDLTQKAVNNEKDFRAFGITVRDAAGNFLDTEQILANVADRIQAAATETEAFAIADDLASDAGRRLLPILRQGAEGIERFKSEAMAAGAVITTQQEALAGEYREAVLASESAFARLSREIGETFTPAVVKAKEFTASFVNVLADLVDEMQQRAEARTFTFEVTDLGSRSAGAAFAVSGLADEMKRLRKETKDAVEVIADPLLTDFAFELPEMAAPWLSPKAKQQHERALKEQADREAEARQARALAAREARQAEIDAQRQMEQELRSLWLDAEPLELSEFYASPEQMFEVQEAHRKLQKLITQGPSQEDLDANARDSERADQRGFGQALAENMRRAQEQVTAEGNKLLGGLGDIAATGLDMFAGFGAGIGSAFAAAFSGQDFGKALEQAIGQQLVALGSMLVQTGIASLLLAPLAFIPFFGAMFGAPGQLAATGAALTVGGAAMIGIGSAMGGAGGAASAGGAGGSRSRRGGSQVRGFSDPPRFGPDFGPRRPEEQRAIVINIAPGGVVGGDGRRVGRGVAKVLEEATG